ncbi:MAG: hypothetical protein K1X81_08080 [Bacteroidia bacterium]|nr:hypothetical protein [Bacteroidia bacterium]
MRFREHTITIYFLILTLLPVSMIVDACRHDAEPVASLTIFLRWNPSHANQTPEQVLTGLRWGLSFLGATLPVEDDDELFFWKSNSLLQVNMNKAGFSDQAKKNLFKLVTNFKESEEYRKSGGMDIGRFIMLTVNSSKHYYAITGIATTYPLFRTRYSFESKKAGIIESEVSYKHRIIEFPTDSTLFQTAFVAHETEGSILTGNYTITEFEVFDVMPNGQLRFGIYNTNGNLIPASDSSKSSAGKPAKCLWCHEVNILQPFFATTVVPGYYTPAEFTARALGRKKALENQRTLISGSSIDFSRKQDHTQLELLYISFMEPSAERLAKEWDMSLSEVMQRLNGLSTHIHQEFPFLGTLYNRNEVDPLGPYHYLRVPDSARNFSSYEPDLIY